MVDVERFIEEFRKDPDNNQLYLELEEINNRDPNSEPISEYIARVFKEPVHYFVGDVHDGKHIVEHVLCWSHKDWEEARGAGVIKVAYLEEKVTCLKCLAWLHA